MESYVVLNHRSIQAYGMELAAVLQSLSAIEQMEKRDYPKHPSNQPFWISNAAGRVQRCLSFWSERKILNELNSACTKGLLLRNSDGEFAIDYDAIKEWEARF